VRKIIYVIDALDDQQLVRLIYPTSDVRVSNQFQLPDWAEVLQELKRKGITKHLLWEEYTQAYPNRSYSYAQRSGHTIKPDMVQ